jgi:probable phosphoglycerate mutase
MELLLIRHGEPLRVVDADGPADPHLHRRGRSQANRLAAYLSGEAIDVVISSPLRRARETAEVVAAQLGLTVLVDDDFAEWDRTSTSYLPMEELKAANDPRFLALIADDLAALGVDVDGFRRTVITAAERVIAEHPGQRVAVVCHGGVINAYIGHLIGAARFLWFGPDYTSINRVVASRNGVRSIRTVNEAAHLRGSDLLAAASSLRS